MRHLGGDPAINFATQRSSFLRKIMDFVLKQRRTAFRNYKIDVDRSCSCYQ